MIEALAAAATAVLLTADPWAKAAGAKVLHDRWLAGAVMVGAPIAMPDRPGRPSRPVLVPPGQSPRRGRGGSARARFALLHAVAHIELNAIDLAIDMAGRFAPAMQPPAAVTFAGDWLRVAAEEATHFELVSALLAERGGRYGDLPAHDGLWEAAQATAPDLLARLAVVPQVLEARGLDVTPAMIEGLDAAGDPAAADVLARILIDEIGHVAVGNRWFRRLCDESGINPKTAFHVQVRNHFRGAIKPPFNDSARGKAGLTPDWYIPLGRAVSDSER